MSSNHPPEEKKSRSSTPKMQKRLAPPTGARPKSAPDRIENFDFDLPPTRDKKSILVSEALKLEKERKSLEQSISSIETICNQLKESMQSKLPETTVLTHLTKLANRDPLDITSEEKLNKTIANLNEDITHLIRNTAIWLQEVNIHLEHSIKLNPSQENKQALTAVLKSNVEKAQQLMEVHLHRKEKILTDKLENLMEKTIHAMETAITRLSQKPARRSPS